MSDASRVGFVEGEERPEDARAALSPLTREFPCELQRRFVAAALGFQQVRPWEVFVDGDIVDLDVPALAIADGGAMVVRDGDRCRLELFVDRASTPVGRAGLTIPHGLAVKFHAGHEPPGRPREEPRLIPLAPVTGPVAELRAVDGAGELRSPEPRDYAIAIAALESMRLFVVDHIDRLRTTDASDISGRYHVDVGQGSVEIAVHFASDVSRGAAGRALELVLDGAA